jgi:hypothetical protein
MHLIREPPMKALVATIIAIAALYFADQQYTQGQYTDAVMQMLVQIRHSFGA